MTFEDQRHARWRRALLESADGALPTSNCPRPERLWAASRGELSPEQVHSLLDHVAECALCSRALGLARQLGAQLEENLPIETGAASEARRSTWYLPAAAALAATLAIIAGVRWYQPRVPGGSEFREPAAYQPMSLIDEAEPLSRDHCLLRWSAGPEGTRYSVEVADEDFRVVAAARDLETEEFLVPAGALEGLPSGARLFWRVEAHMIIGTREKSVTYTHRLE